MHWAGLWWGCGARTLRGHAWQDITSLPQWYWPPQGDSLVCQANEYRLLVPHLKALLLKTANGQ